MILVTGGTGFIGQALIRRLVESGLRVRTLLRPSSVSPGLPRGVPVEAVICGLRDERGLRAAMKGVDVVYHLAGAERQGSQADLLSVDMEGTRTISAVAADANVQRFFYVSHLGAERSSAYPLLKAKAIAEGHIINSGVPHTIFRSAVAYGPGDQFTERIVRLLKMSPGVFLMPGGGASIIQPLSVEDLVTALTLSLDTTETLNQTFSLGGPEYLTFRKVVEEIKAAAKIRRAFLSISPAYLRILSVFAEDSVKDFPLSTFWQDYLAADRTCELDTLPRLFGLMPERFGRGLDYLRPASRAAERKGIPVS